MERNYSDERQRSLFLVEKLKGKYSRTLFECEHLVVFEAKSPVQHLSVTVGSHGNEVAGTAALNDFIEEYLDSDLPLHLSLSFGFGNIAAAYAGQRFLEKDLERCFGGSGIQFAEDRIARIYEKHLASSEANLDIHQTIQPTRQPFFLGPQIPKVLAAALEISESMFFIGFPLGSFSADGSPLDEYLCQIGKLGLSVELGQKGFDQQQINLGKDLIWRFLNHQMNFKKQKEGGQSLAGRLGERASRFLSVKHVFRNCPDRKAQLVPGLVNLDPINKDQLLGIKSTGEKIYSPVDGFAVFPKYNEAAQISSELCQIVGRADLSAL